MLWRPACALACLLLVAPAAAAEATQVHLGLAADGYRVTFTLPQGEGGPPAVTYQTAHGAGSATPRQVARASGDPSPMFSALLPADATSYQIGARRFEIQRAAGDHARVVVLADMGASPHSWALWKLASEQQPDAILVAGDVSYANGASAVWDGWFASAEPLASRVPVMAALGNHEQYCSPDDATLVTCARETFEYQERFQLPGNGLYYAFSLGPARFVALNTEAYHPSGDPAAPRTDKGAQTAFLRESLASAGDAWRIVFFHRPLYSSNVHDNDMADPAPKADWLPILDSGDASLVLNGHAHAYERTYPLRGDAVAAKADDVRAGQGFVEVTTGGGGRSLYADFAQPQPEWSAKRAAEYELVVLDITKERIEGKALREDGSVLDAFSIYREKGAETSSVPLLKGAPGVTPLALIAAVGALALARRLRS